ncbi:hypothetical protein KAFR_0E01260 [Kazachstania africana CBS 2517]|uniref:PRP1 splicing factor N-terminal domain-containing protein n=1 Tax=Kazachstania africana (strain ATCC 22294 / BCRC 22015 / CBS 2517 / CECT 1963 / NBRC 1671 / NRRL Y-8276) TaxID=1071382 RepID=H2AV80_KAZAF|nr:hypothetical protein KAFR_0E01260 [Kazachstania africana CBS 2517]CCF58280.1 hypothetical protein KAFR_0E01260 [Kazachstania africana CBS 2517]
MDRPAFLDMDPPPGYIPGIGRGATGFSIRGEKSAKIPNRLQQNGRSNEISKQNKDQDLSDNDNEGDMTFNMIDKRLEMKGTKAARVNKDKGDGKGQFSDVKRSLATVSEEQWMNIPDAVDITRRNKRSRLEEQLNRKTYAAPDSLVSRNVNLTKLTEEREKILGRQLDVAFLDKNQNNGGQDYLTQLESLGLNTSNNVDAQDEDLQRMRIILKSYRNSDPKSPQGWIASARLEERAQKFKVAKKIIEQGCAECPRNEDIWLESIRHNQTDLNRCKELVAAGIHLNPNSKSLWIKAIELEHEPFNKHRVIKRALQELPNDETLWKLVIKHENDKDEALKILEKAVEFVPDSMDLWGALVNSQSYTMAKATLNRARQYLLKNVDFWILATQLEEKHNNDVSLEELTVLIQKGLDSIYSSETPMPLHDLLKKATLMETKGTAKKTHEAYIRVVLRSQIQGTGGEAELKIFEGLENSLTKIYCYRILLETNPLKLSIWNLLKNTCEDIDKVDELHKTFDNILFQDQEYRILKQSPNLVLVYAKELWKYNKNIDKAIEVINKAIEVIPISLDLFFAKIKLLCESQQFDRVELLFEKMENEMKNKLENDSMGRFYYKYVNFLRFRGENSTAIKILEDICLSNYDNNYKFYLQLGQIFLDIGRFENARETFKVGTNKLEACAPLWLALANVDEKQLKNTVKARSDLDLGLIKNPNNEELIVAKAQLEERLGNKDQAKLIIAQALKAHPEKASLWTESIRLLRSQKSSSKKTTFQDALKHTKNDYRVLLEIGISFYLDSQFVTASKWIERAAKANTAYGDSWVWLCRCYRKQRKETSSIYKQVQNHEPRYGPEWISISKDVKKQFANTSQILDFLTN